MQAHEYPWVVRVPDWLARHQPQDANGAGANLLPILRHEHQELIPADTLPSAESCTLDFITLTVNKVLELGCVAFTYERRSYKHRGKGKYWYWSMCRAEQIEPPQTAISAQSAA